ncbi:MAG TPA: protein kinase, partial [Ktedonobacteraceae bacterium]
MAGDRVGQTFGNYQLLRLLGQGTFAEVYLGEHRYLEILAAIKVLHVHLPPDTYEPFLQEARTIAHLHHPHIIHILDFGIQEQTPYLVMEYTPNGTLRSKHARGTQLSLEQIVIYVKQIAAALDYAHQQHVVHRDIKPDNILLNAENNIVVSDFGIAIVQQTWNTSSTQNQAGTPLYMAPEQIQKHPSAASDQYALGVIVYEWLCGEPPFPGPGLAIFGQHLYQSPQSLRKRMPHLPPAIEEAVFKALAKEPQQRFACVQDFAAALETAYRSIQVPSLNTSDRTAPLPGKAIMPVPASLPAMRDARQDYPPLPQALTAPSHPAHTGQAIPKRNAFSLSQKNRERLLRRVDSFWIEGMLKHSLHGASLLALGLQEQPDAIVNPWHLVFQSLDAAPRPLPTSTHITEVYDAAMEELLILGAPGAGKTTLLLELTRELLERAVHDEQHPIPVVFLLSSWAMKQRPLANWLIEELRTKYQVPVALGKGLVNAGQILPLLDGLDEMAARDRSNCIEAINLYRQKQGLLPLVVCCRNADYLAQNARLHLRSAVTVQPLSLQQIDNYLQQAGSQLAGLRVALTRDPELQELATTPLLLNILTLAYQETTQDEIASHSSVPEMQRQVFATYVQRMLVKNNASTRYQPEQTMHWLAWLAQQMKQHNESVFYIEDMQSDWLPTPRARKIYSCIVGGIIGWLLIGLASGWSFWWALGLSSGLLYGPLLGLIGGGVVGLETNIQPTTLRVWSWTNTRRNILISLIVGLSIGALLTLLFGPSLPMLGVILFFLAICLWISILTIKQPVEILEKHTLATPNYGTRLSALNGILIGLGVGFLAILTMGLIVLLLGGGANFTMNGILFILSIGLFTAVIGG